MGCEVRSCRVDLDCTVSPAHPAYPVICWYLPLPQVSPLSHLCKDDPCSRLLCLPKSSCGEHYRTFSHLRTTSDTILPATDCVLAGRFGLQSERSRVWGSGGILGQIISLILWTCWGLHESSDPQGKVWVSYRSQRKGELSCSQAVPDSPEAWGEGVLYYQEGMFNLKDMGA